MIRPTITLKIELDRAQKNDVLSIRYGDDNIHANDKVVDTTYEGDSV